MRPTAERAGKRGRLLSLAVRTVAGLLILVVALGIAGLLVANRAQPEQTPFTEAVRRVRVVEVVPRPAETLTRAWEGFGTARAKQRADIAPEVGGRVISRPEGIDAGVAVAAGQVLIQIDPEDYRERMEAAQRAAEALEAQLQGLGVEQERTQEQLNEARQQIELAQWELDRLEEARAGAASSDIEMVRLRANLSRLETERSRLQQQVEIIPSRRAALEAELAARRSETSVAQRQLERTRIVSPIAGVLQEIEANIGETLQPGQPIARVVDLSRIEIPLRVPASAQGEIRIGDAAVLRAAGGDAGPEWRARVVRVAPEADPQTRTVTVFLELEQSPPPPGEPLSASAWAQLLMPGRFVAAELRGRAGNGELLALVPRRAIADDVLWVAVPDEEGVVRAQPRQVRVLYNVEGDFPELDSAARQWSVVGQGVEPGDRVIVTNLDELQPGVRVELVPGGEVTAEVPPGPG